MVWGWWIFFLRSICPIALSSPVCIIPAWNRQYHRLLSELGLTIQDKQGIMRSWISVFRNDIVASDTFKICSIIWVVGVIGVLFFGIINYYKLQKELKTANVIGENIYESSMLLEPVSLGFFHEKIYLPRGFQTKETAWLLRHMEQHKKEGWKRILPLVIMACHWFNPAMWLYCYWWNIDTEMAADDRTVYRKKEAERKEYAQGILNFTKESKDGNKRAMSGLLLLGVTEKYTKKRAYRMMYQKGEKINDKLFGVLLLSLVIVLCFLLRPMQIAWSGGTWGNAREASKKETLFDKTNTTVVAKMGTKSPEGLERIVQLEMTKGTENEKGFDGTFVLKMYDMMENEIATCKVEDIFPKIEKGSFHFSKNVTLCISDYNKDNVQELVIGQQADLEEVAAPEEEIKPDFEVYSYAIINIKDKELEILSHDIHVIGEKENMSESILFEKPEGIEDIFMVPFGEETLYYVWNSDNKNYEKRTMAEKELEAHRQIADEQAVSGEIIEHTLEKSDGTVAALVSTKQDKTQSEVIQSITLFPRGASKKFEDIQGYYCDLLWVSSADEENRYAQLIYNGTKSQTFVLYDTKKKNVYYQHEDGTKNLAAVFKQYQEDGITFKEDGAVIYDLAEKKGDVLNINFAAEADNNVTVRGSYEYNVVKRTASNLSFSRAVENDTEETTAP